MPTTTKSNFPPGSLVSCRDRLWVVMPSQDDTVTLLRPVDGREDDHIGLFSGFGSEDITDDEYPDPNSNKPGDFQSALLLRDAVRLSLRAGAGPFRSVGRLSVTPRPYQYVPLVMSLRLNPVRMLIADDVGVGKTIEAGIVARELLDRRLAHRIGVLCPPHLCDQWSQELRDKFGIETAAVQSSQMGRLERNLPRPDLQVFAHYQHLVASIDYIKSDRHFQSFVDNAPDFIIVDEAHIAARPRGDESGQQQRRHRLLQRLAQDPNRHIVLVTATPHSGIEESFRSLLGTLDSSFDKPIEQNIPNQQLKNHLVQRRRADLIDWLGSKTPFPERDDQEMQYTMSSEYQALYTDILDFCREIVSGATGRQRRVRYWSAVSILRCVLSSPAAAESTLQRQAERRQDALAEDEIGEEEFVAQIMDSAVEQDNPPDYAPTAALEDPDAGLRRQELRRLNAFLERAQHLRGQSLDAKLAQCREVIADMLAQSYRPIVYCRFIATARYVAEQLEESLASDYSDIDVRSVTGGDGNDEQRRKIIDELAQAPRRVLVATDCLSEGINLQEHFDAVLHYDLPWNPNRLEQREGRVDRYGQTSPQVKCVMLWGSDNEIDLTVLNVLIRKAREIRKRLGISVTATVESDEVLQAVIDDVLARGSGGIQPELLTMPRVSSYHSELDTRAERESKQRAYFAQESIQPDEIARELRELEPALGSHSDVQNFVHSAIQRFNGNLDTTRHDGVFALHPGDLEQELRERLPKVKFPMRVSFDNEPRAGVLDIGRNNAIVEALTDRVLTESLAEWGSAFARCGAIYTNTVTRRTAVVILRLRYLLDEGGALNYAEEVVTAAFERKSGKAEWLELYRMDTSGEPHTETALSLLTDAKPSGNMAPEEQSRHVEQMLAAMKRQQDWAAAIIERRKASIQAAHKRVRVATTGGKPIEIGANPPDIIGCYVLVPGE